MSLAPSAGEIEPAAARLVGLTLNSGWNVVERIARDGEATGGQFSCQYIVHKNGRQAFLKALDYSRVLLRAKREGHDVPTVLQNLVTAYNFERGLLQQCAQRRMDRVVLAIEDGSVEIPGELFPVNYLIFERADGDIRKHFAFDAAVSCAWKLRCLHHITTGLWQMHSINAAHQDLKPSNVLVFGRTLAKIADLGCASVRGTPCPRDELAMPGDPSYAPPELLYGFRAEEWNRRHQACDVYHLGSMCVFMFCGLGMTTMTLRYIHPSRRPSGWDGEYVGEYATILPEVRDAFGLALGDFESSIEDAAMRPELRLVVGQLCDPNPALRGHPSNRMTASNNPFSLERYVSIFDRLASTAERRLRVTG